MKIIKKYLIPVLVLILFVLLMNSGEFLKKSFNNKDNVNKALAKVENDLIIEQWQQADNDLRKLNAAWKIVQTRVQFSAEKDVINEININLSRIQGAIIAKDKTAAIIELSEFKLHWDNL